MSCKREKCSRVSLKLSIAGKKKTNKHNFKDLWNQPQNFRTGFAFFFLHTSSIQSYCLCKIKISLLLLGQDLYEDYRFSHTHSDKGFRATVMLLYLFLIS